MSAGAGRDGNGRRSLGFRPIFDALGDHPTPAAPRRRPGAAKGRQWAGSSRRLEAGKRTSAPAPDKPKLRRCA